MSSGCILVVEDEVFEANGMCNEIRSAGYEVPDFASSTTIAIQRSLFYKVDSVIVDLRLSDHEMGGAFVANVLYRWQKIPSIVVSAHATTATKDLLIQARSVVFKKPVPNGQLFQPIAECIADSEINRDCYLEPPELTASPKSAESSDWWKIQTNLRTSSPGKATNALLKRIEVFHIPCSELLDLLELAEVTQFSATQQQRLAPCLLGIALRYRSSNDMVAKEVVRSAIRGFAAFADPQLANIFSLFLDPNEFRDVILTSLLAFLNFCSVCPLNRAKIDAIEIDKRLMECARSFLDRTVAVANRETMAIAKSVVLALVAANSKSAEEFAKQLFSLGDEGITSSFCSSLDKMQNGWKARGYVPSGDAVAEKLLRFRRSKL